MTTNIFVFQKDINMSAD